VALLGAVAGLVFWRRRRATTLALLALAIIAFTVALGPTWTRADGREIALPYRFLFDLFPFFTAMRVAARFGVLVNFAIVALAGLGLAALWSWLAPRLAAARARRLGPALTVALAVIICVELASVPIPVRVIDRSAATAAPYEWLAAQPGQGPVMEFPATPGPWATGLMMYWSTVYWKPLVQGTSGFTPLPHREYINAFVAPLVRPDGGRGGRPEPPHAGQSGAAAGSRRRVGRRAACRIRGRATGRRCWRVRVRRSAAGRRSRTSPRRFFACRPARPPRPNSG
jgi:hypothetical protein